MNVDEIVSSMSRGISEKTARDFLDMNKNFNDNRYKILKTKAIDRVALTLLAAAKNSELFYDVVKWGEDVKVASKATFSRRKDFLVNLGVIYEESVKTPFGRPKIRLKLNDRNFKEYFGLD